MVSLVWFFGLLAAFLCGASVALWRQHAVLGDLRALLAVHVQREEQLVQHLMAVLNPQAFQLEAQKEMALKSLEENGKPHGPVRRPVSELAREFPG